MVNKQHKMSTISVHNESFNGGEKGIRTLETVSRLHAFQACAFNHSATSPILFHLATGGITNDIRHNHRKDLLNLSNNFNV